MRETAKRPKHRRNQSEPVLLRFEPTHLEMIDHAAEHLGLARASPGPSLGGRPGRDQGSLGGFGAVGRGRPGE